MRMMLLTMVQSLVDAEATAQIGAAPHERTGARTTQRNGSRDKVLATTAGDLTVKIGEAAGRVVLSLAARAASAHRRRAACGGDAGLDRGGEHPQGRRPGRRARGRVRHQQERGVPDLRPARQRGRRLARPAAEHSAFPYVFLDATYCHSRVGGGAHGKGGHVTSRAVVIATGVSADGRREVLGCQVGDSQDEVF